MNKKTRSIMFSRAERDENLMFPLHKSDFNHPVREQFIKDLCNSEDFVPVKNKMEEKYTDSLKSIIGNFSTRDYVFVLLFSAMISGNVGFLFSHKLFHHDDKEYYNERFMLNMIDLVGITALVIAGLYLGKLLLGSIKQSRNELSMDRFYHRMSVRLFYKFKKIYPELNVETLEHCNPEMARVIKTLLMANMSEEDTEKIKDIAIRLSEYKYSKLHKGDIEDLKGIEKSLKNALTIVSECLNNNPELAKVIYEVYKGQVPKTFVLNPNNQKIKE